MVVGEVVLDEVPMLVVLLLVVAHTGEDDVGWIVPWVYKARRRTTAMMRRRRCNVRMPMMKGSVQSMAAMSLRGQRDEDSGAQSEQPS